MSEIECEANRVARIASDQERLQHLNHAQLASQLAAALQQPKQRHAPVHQFEVVPRSVIP